MEGAIQFSVLLFFQVLITAIIGYCISDDSHIQKRRLENKLRDIMYFNDKEYIDPYFSYRNKTFKVEVKKGDVHPRLPIKSLEVLINDECAATLFIFTAGCFIYCRSFKPSPDRNEIEIRKIINVARKIYNKRAETKIKEDIEIRRGTKSFFN